MITLETKGNFKKLDKFLAYLQRGELYKGLESLAQQGVNALAAATPKDTGLASQSWGYEIQTKPGSCTITWTNSDVENGFPVVIMLQYGHGTGTGGYVQGQDFINSALKPVFDSIAEKVWKEVKSA